MKKVQKPSNSKGYTPSSESFRKEFLSAHKHKTLTMLSFTAEYVTSALSSKILSALVARECINFYNLVKLVYHV